LCTFAVVNRLVPINIIKLHNNNDFDTINYKVHVCILHASLCQHRKLIFLPRHSKKREVCRTRSQPKMEMISTRKSASSGPTSTFTSCRRIQNSTLMAATKPVGDTSGHFPYTSAMRSWSRISSARATMPSVRNITHLPLGDHRSESSVSPYSSAVD
jgi:hypothetical protein